MHIRKPIWRRKDTNLIMILFVGIQIELLVSKLSLNASLKEEVWTELVTAG
jgi:hypothetical protein